MVSSLQRVVVDRSTARSTGATPVERGWRADAFWVVPLLVLFLVKGALLAAMVGPFTGHDEVDHFFYVARLAAGDGLGVVGEVDLPAEAEPYRRYVADYPTNAEVIQPPLYHALLVPLFLATPGGTEARLILLRLASVPVGAAVVWVAYLTARLLFPREALLRAGVPIFVAFQPQFAFEAAIVNHDVLLILLVSLALYLTLGGLRDGFSVRRQWALGLIGAAGLWTKVSFGLVLPVVGLGLVLAWWNGGGSWRELVRPAWRALGVPLLLASPWFLRSFLLYGDPTGAGRLRAIPEYGEQARTYPEMIRSGSFWRQLLEDSWGNFGWRQIPLDPWDFRAVWLLWALALLGLAVGAVRTAASRRAGMDHSDESGTRWRRQGVALLAFSVGSMVFGVLYVGTIQFTQARFAFPAVVGVGTLTLLGVGGWLPARARPAALPVLVALLMALNVVVALRFMLPFYYGPGGGAAIAPVAP
jgi:4-amino-4-deoxy-L-arabinose transferase-like glycosyltransferase